jgi:hypothetical protein
MRFWFSSRLVIKVALPVHDPAADREIVRRSAFDGSGRRIRLSGAGRHALVAIRYSQVPAGAWVPSYRSRAFHARSILSCGSALGLVDGASICAVREP